MNAESLSAKLDAIQGAIDEIRGEIGGVGTEELSVEQEDDGEEAAQGDSEDAELPMKGAVVAKAMPGGNGGESPLSGFLKGASIKKRMA